MSEPTFDERLQSLLAKIYNETYELTFTNTSKTVRIDEGYRPPSSLHVIRYTRAEFKKSYCAGGTIFYVDCDFLVNWVFRVARHDVKAPSQIRVTGAALDEMIEVTSYNPELKAAAKV